MSENGTESENEALVRTLAENVNRVPMATAHDVVRDENGAPVTITGLQAEAIWHAIAVWMDVVRAEKGAYPPMGMTMRKSCLLGRMLFDGRPPLPSPPPLINSAPAYHKVDPELCPTCGEERAGRAGRLGASVAESALADFKDLARRGNDPIVGSIRAVFECAEQWHNPRP